MSDFEYSTFQNRPAYRYIRESDRLPGLDVEDDPYPMARIKLFDPTGSWTWYIASYDAASRTAFGMVHGHEHELGYISMEEIVEFRGRMGLPIERDLHFKPVPLEEVA
jgi:hypothetical protein